MLMWKFRVGPASLSASKIMGRRRLITQLIQVPFCTRETRSQLISDAFCLGCAVTWPACECERSACLAAFCVRIESAFDLALEWRITFMDSRASKSTRIQLIEWRGLWANGTHLFCLHKNSPQLPSYSTSRVNIRYCARVRKSCECCPTRVC